MNKGSRTFNIINITLMTLIVIVTLYPFWYIFAVSFNEGKAAARGGIYFFPRVFTTDNYRAVFRNKDLTTAFAISGLRTIIGTFLHVFFTGMVAFAMSKSNLIGRKFYMLIGTITLFFSGGLIPYYLLIRDLGMRNNFMVYIIPAMFNFWDMVIMMTFFRELPGELSESANIDGAGDLRVFLSIILPLSKPILATMALFCGVYYWNDFFTAVLFVDKRELLPIQTVLFKIIAEADAKRMLSQVNLPDVIAKRTLTSEAIKLATMVVTTVPVICVYPFLQKYFVKGMLIGSVKG
jgi:putative aldouronate transport system permease protein